MAPAKRGRPAFSPPRPGKSKSQPEVTHVSTAMAGREAKLKNGRNAAVAKKRALGTSTKKPTTPARKRGRPSKSRQEEEEEDEDSDDDDNGRSALALVDMQAGVDDDDEDDEEEEGEDDEEEDASEEDSRISKKRSRTNVNDSPEPDMMLAEITTANGPSAGAIPEKLVHRLLAHHFEQGEKTKISTDARDLVSKYLEVFVREAIMRSAFEKDERLTVDGGGGGGGFLEVEDLERAAVQLCLDF